MPDSGCSRAGGEDVGIYRLGVGRASCVAVQTAWSASSACVWLGLGAVA